MPRTDLVETPHGRCLIVEIPGDGEPDVSTLVGDEVALAASLGPLRRRELVAGRTAMRSSLMPTARAASTKASSRTARVFARITRAA